MLARLCSFARRLPRVLSGLHHLVIWQCVIYWPWRAGAEQKGDEEEGHYVIPHFAYR